MRATILVPILTLITPTARNTGKSAGLCHAKINYANHVDALNNETKESGADGKCDVCGYEVADPNPDEPDPDNPDPDNPNPDDP